MSLWSMMVVSTQAHGSGDSWPSPSLAAQTVRSCCHWFAWTLALSQQTLGLASEPVPELSLSGFAAAIA